MNTKILSIEKLNKTFLHGKAQALKNCSLEVSKNSITGLLGMNGAGKTTLIKCVANLLIPDSGNVYFENNDLLKKPEIVTNNISVLLDGGRNLFWYMTVEENIKYFSLLKAANKFDKTRFAKIAQYLELEPILKKQLHQLSFGMKQRANIAVALMSSAQLLIFDEPTTGLDVKFQAELERLIVELHKEFDVSILLSSHDMDFVKRTCNDCILIHEGQTLKQGSMQEFMSLFETSRYEVMLYEPLIDDVKKELQENFDITEMNDTSFSIFWGNNKELNEMFAKLNSIGIKVKMLNSENTLRASIMQSINNNKSEEK
jgi:ABC transporter, ATP-binding protein